MKSLSRITSELLSRSAIAPGMKVLDIGCGGGELTFAVAALVGPDGHVTGIDANQVALAGAIQVATAAGLANVDFIEADLSVLALPLATFDAIVCRRVLMYLPDAPSVIRKMAALLRPGGTMAVQEHDSTMTPGRIGAWPLHDQAHHWLWETVTREGADPNIGMRLAPMLEDAGLEVRAFWSQGIFAGHEAGIHHSLAEIVGFTQARILAHGVASAAEIDLASLPARLAAERLGHQTSYLVDMAMCVVARKPPGHAPDPEH